MTMTYLSASSCCLIAPDNANSGICRLKQRQQECACRQSVAKSANVEDRLKCSPREGEECDKHGAEGKEEHLKEEQAIGVLRC